MSIKNKNSMYLSLDMNLVYTRSKTKLDPNSNRYNTKCLILLSFEFFIFKFIIVRIFIRQIILFNQLFTKLQGLSSLVSINTKANHPSSTPRKYGESFFRVCNSFVPCDVLKCDKKILKKIFGVQVQVQVCNPVRL